jgi:hexosaminidase
MTIALLAALALVVPKPVQDTGLSVIPQPIRVTRSAGAFVLTARAAIATDAATRDVGYALADYVAPATGYRLPVRATAGSISIRTDTSLARLGDEGYRLVVTPTAISIRAFKPAGAFYAVQTLRQLLPPDIYRQAPIEGVSWRIPAVTIEDYPRFSWRGAHLDVSRHFMPKEFVKKYIDLLALHKLNRFHWHLTDDQGWRIQILKYPRLTEVGAWRSQTIIGKPDRNDSTTWTFDGRPHGGFYTQDDIREVVAYAQARFVTVVPEIEMPGHSQAAIAAYPELGNTGQQIAVWTRWGVSPNILKPEEPTIRFYQDVLTEVMALFPGRWIHVGGDEADKEQWLALRGISASDAATLQSWFIGQMDAFLTAHGRTLVGWDEILEGGLAPNAVVMSWRGTDGGIAAAQADHDVVMTPGSHTYFDHYETLDTAREPIAIGGYLPIDTVYSYDPVPDALTPAQARHVLGAQGQMWTEYIPDSKQAEYMVFPRLCALAEVVWTRADRKNFADFRARLDTHLKRLAILDVNYRGRAEPRL